MSINRVLEIGLSFILFVGALSVFILMNDGIISLTQSDVSSNEEMQVTMAEGTLSVQAVTLAEIYLMLTDEAFMHQDNQLGEVSYISSEGMVAVYIDDVYYTPVTDYKGRQSLRRELLALPSFTFDKRSHTDSQGTLTELHFRSR